MSRATSLAAAGLAALMSLLLVACEPIPAQSTPAATPGTPANSVTEPRVAAVTQPGAGLLYGRVTANGEVYEGRLRWGRGDLEATWTDWFDGHKDENPWADFAPPELENPQPRFELFGIEFGPDPSPLARQFLAHFGDIVRVDTSFSEARVTLKSGTIVTLDRFAAGDIDDGVRVWEAGRGVVDLDTRLITAIEFLPTPPLADAPDQLHGVVHTRAGSFTGFIQWNQRHSLMTDTLEGRTADGTVTNERFATIRTIARESREGAVVTLLDGRVLTLSGTRDTGRQHRGLHVDDSRYGRVLIPWDRFERVELSPGGSGPAYADFQPGRALEGTVTTRDGRRLSGRLVYDIDESDTTETLDVAIDGVTYAVPFDRIDAIVPPGVAGGAAGRVVLESGEELHVDRSGDVGDQNNGLLIFATVSERPEHVPWNEVARIDFDHAGGPGAPAARP